MSDEAGAVKRGPFRNPDGTLSLKKILGVIFAVIAVMMGVFGIYKDPSPTTILGVLDRMLIFSGSLLGLKVASGGVQALINRGNRT